MSDKPHHRDRLLPPGYPQQIEVEIDGAKHRLGWHQRSGKISVPDPARSLSANCLVWTESGSGQSRRRTGNTAHPQGRASRPRTAAGAAKAAQTTRSAGDDRGHGVQQKTRPAARSQRSNTAARCKANTSPARATLTRRRRSSRKGLLPRCSPTKLPPPELHRPSQVCQTNHGARTISQFLISAKS